MPRRSSHPFDALAEHFAQIFAGRISAALPKAGRNGIARKSRELQARHELPLPWVQGPVEGAAVPLSLRGASQAPEEEAG